ncbi:uncharacterized protein HD556DRAFT_1310092 [Suillus plorans]|uniref:Uncharacterized protein n=1 Tax=Suillus plorans TaxID=116603 RepID=A0A9P7AM87_9AGAM|nr:uncharacterized protein HD556DRAFT_1313776 [Suillus plorans]XP_041158108.1 uncharacterized protein HD556DRAFT_1310092 [Suillus plorans]KAG1786107.1 hypothetical protein HD556DRAFT_1313776 [Suillus plorans]KAG1791223.1 hypothetical protein HD556DRAFT_1310092 [Suillus plorans]
MTLSDDEECLNKLRSSLLCKNIGLLKFKSSRTLKIDYVEALLNWRCAKPLAAPREEHLFVVADVLGHIHDVIQDTSVPSWLGSVPSNFGEVSAGTIKADEWQLLVMVYLPLPF